VAASLCRTDTALNLGECPLHRGARQIKLRGQLAKGGVWCPRSRTGDPLVHSICLEKILLQCRRARSRLPHPSMHCAGEVRGLGIHTAIQVPSNLSADATRLHLSDGSRCAESPQQIDEHLATLPYQEPLAASLSPMSA
jgi:hypothetical protein